MNRGDKFVWWACLLIAGWLAGTWMTPEPRFAACIEVPSKTPVAKPGLRAMSARSQARWAKYLAARAS